MSIVTGGSWSWIALYDSWDVSGGREKVREVAIRHHHITSCDLHSRKKGQIVCQIVWANQTICQMSWSIQIVCQPKNCLAICLPSKRVFAKQKKCLPDKTSVGQSKRVFAKLFAFLPKSLRNSLANRLISPNYLANCLLFFSGVLWRSTTVSFTTKPPALDGERGESVFCALCYLCMCFLVCARVFVTCVRVKVLDSELIAARPKSRGCL